MELMEAIRGRRAVRDYKDRPVEEAVIARLIDAAVQAPTAIHREPWLFLVVTNRRRLDYMARAAKEQVLASMDGDSTLAGFRSHLSDPGFDIFYHAPVLVLICTTVDDEMARHDCCLAAENLMLAAHAEGLGSCWIGFAEAWLNTAEATKALPMLAGARPVAPIILGYPTAPPSSPGRKPALIEWMRE